MKTPPIATKFVKHEVPPLETLKDSYAYRLREKLNRGERPTTEEKEWLTERVNTNTFFKTAVPVRGWRFDFSDILRRFLVRQHNCWNEYRAPDKSSLRRFIPGHIDEIVEIKKKSMKNEKQHIQSLDGILRTINDNLKALHEVVMETVKANGGLIHTQNPSCDTIYSIEYLTEAGGEVTENEIVGIRVKNEDLQILSEPQSKNVRTIVTKEDLTAPCIEDEWRSVKDSCEVFYVETLLAMAESIEQYI